MNEFIEIQICNLVSSLIRNINDNFINVSFDVLENGCIQVKIILKNLTNAEKEYIDDISGEFEATQEKNIVERFEITTEKNSIPRKYVVYNRIRI